MAEEKTRRDFIFIATGAAVGIGAVGATWPLIRSMSPASDSVDPKVYGPIVDLSLIEEGQQLKLLFQGKPIFIRHRTAEEISAAQNVDVRELPHPEFDEDRLRPNLKGERDPKYLVMVGICPHFGCVPVGESGNFDGWFCPCHGAHFDTSGRVRSGPPPVNMRIPYYIFKSNQVIQLVSYAAFVALTS